VKYIPLGLIGAEILRPDALPQWLNYSKVGGGFLNSGVNVELVPVV